MHNVYIIALGGVGTKIIKEMYDLGIRPPDTILQRLGIIERNIPGKLMPNSEVQIIDMAYERDKHEYLKNEHGLFEGDHIKILEFSEQEYNANTILRLSKVIGFDNIVRYWFVVHSSLGILGPRQGVKRYRPLARYFVSRAANIIRQTIIDDYENDFHYQPTVNIFIASAGGGFGSGSLLTIASIAKHEGVHGTKNVLFLHIPIGGRYRLPVNDTPFGEEDAYASIGMTLLEIMYIYELHRNGKPYEDELTRYITREMGLSEAERFWLWPFDLLILSGLASSAFARRASSIQEEFDDHDKRFATIILSTIAGFRSGEREPLQILEDNPNIRAYEANVYSMLSMNGVPSSIAYPVEVYGIEFIPLSRKTVRSLAEKLKKLIAEKERVTNIIKETEKLITEKKKELGQLHSQKIRIEGEKRNIDSLELEPLENLLKNIPRGQEILEDIDAIRKNSHDIISKIDSDINTRIGTIRGIIASGENLSSAIPLAQQLNLDISWISTSFNNIKGQLDVLVNEFLSEQVREDEIKKAILYIKVIDRLTSILHRIRIKLEGLRENIDKVLAEVEKRKGRIFCGAACDIKKRLRNAPTDIQIILGDLEAYTRKLNEIKEKLNTIVKDYKDKINRSLSDIEERIKTIKQELNELEEKTSENEAKASNIHNELVNSAIQFLDNFINRLDKIGALHIDIATRENLVREIVQTKEKLNMLKGMLESENELRKFESIEGALEQLSKLSSVIGAQIRERLVEALIDGAKRSISLNIDDKEAFVRAFAIGGANNEQIRDSDLTRYISQELYYVIYTPDNKGLAEKIAQSRSDKEVNLVEVASDRTSFIGFIVKKINVPLISIREARRALRSALKKVLRTVFECDKESSSIIDASTLQECRKTIREYAGLQYATLDIRSREFLEFLDRIKQALDQYSKISGAE